MAAQLPHFVKMEGCGNHFVVFAHEDPGAVEWSGFVRQVTDPHFGVGGDGVMIVGPEQDGLFQVEMFNPDGSGMGMCGNGIRCVARFIAMEGLSRAELLRFRVCGSREVSCRLVGPGAERQVEVDMGEPGLNPAEIPVTAGAPVIDEPLSVAGREFRITCLSMGNPHCVVFIDDTSAIDLPALGPLFERHSFFPNRVTTEFVTVLRRGLLKVTVWERGAGATQACGTGACAALVAGVLTSRSDIAAKVQLPGGDLAIRWDREGSGRVYLTGSAREIFRGTLCNSN